MALVFGPDMTVGHEETAAAVQLAADSTGQAPAVSAAIGGTASVAKNQHPHPQSASGHKRPRTVWECGAPPVVRSVRPRTCRHITTPPSMAVATLAARVKMATEPGTAFHTQQLDLFLLSAAVCLGARKRLPNCIGAHRASVAS